MKNTCFAHIFRLFSFLLVLIISLPAEASMEEAFFAARNRDFKAAFKLFLAEAQRGNADAQYRLGGMYKSGQGIEKNPVLAQEWYTKAADLGHVKAGKRLAVAKKSYSEAPAVASDLNPQLLRAARKGNLGKIRELVKTGANINFQDMLGVTALMEAIRSHHNDLVTHLLTSKANAGMQNADGDTALLIATGMGNLATVKKLVRYGANINDRDQQKNTPLILAIYRNDQPMAEYLLARNADIFALNSKGQSAFDIAVNYKNKKLSQLIRKSGGKKLTRQLAQKAKTQTHKHLQSQAKNIKERGWTKIMYCAWRGDENAVAVALSENPDLELKDKTGMTALALAAQGGHLDIIYTLLDAGADLTCGDDTTKHAFYVAAKQGHGQIVRPLVSALKENASCRQMLESTLTSALQNSQMDMADILLSADIAFAGGAINSPLIMMAAKADDRLITRLLKSGLDVNGVNSDGHSALMVAARHGNDPALKSLLAHGANINQKDTDSRTALVHGAQNGKLLAVKILVDAGADIYALTGEGNSALMLAAEKGDEPTVSYLAKFKNLDHKNSIGDTALIMAARGGFYNISETLLSEGANPRMRNNRREKAQSVVGEDKKGLLALLEKYDDQRSWLQDVF